MLFLTKSWRLVYGDGGTGDGGTGDGGTGDGGTGDGTGDPKVTDIKVLVEKHGLQDQLNNMMASNRKQLTAKNTELVQQLQSLRDEATMSTQAKEELESRIEELQTQFLSKEELAKREIGKASKQHAQEVEKLTGDATKWQKLYASSTTQRALLDAAVAGEAIQPQQIVAMLGQNTHVIEELNPAGQPSGKYVTIVKFNDVNTEGANVTLDLSPKDAIKRMKELPAMYGNLFKGNSTSGLGGSGSAAGGEVTPKAKELMTDPKKYKAWRKKNPDLDISKLR